jgi:soluble lytic murein transglycosylase-like protein
MAMRLSPRFSLVPAAAAILLSHAPAVSAQDISPLFSYTRNETGTVSISDKGLVASAGPVAAPSRRTRGSEFDAIIEDHAQAQGLHPALVRAVIEAESAFNPRAVSRVGAMGLMQLMPGTARELGVNDPFDPVENIRGGTTYLRSLLDRFGGDVRLALAAYNAGPGAVERYDGVPPYRETRGYVAKISNRISNVTAIRRGSLTIYKVTEVTPEGREIVKYTDKKPAAPHDIVSLRSR